MVAGHGPSTTDSVRLLSKLENDPEAGLEKIDRLALCGEHIEFGVWDRVAPDIKRHPNGTARENFDATSIIDREPRTEDSQSASRCVNQP